MYRKMFAIGLGGMLGASVAIADQKSVVLCKESKVAADFAVSLLNKELQQSSVSVRTLTDDQGNGTEYVRLDAPFTVSSASLTYIPKTVAWSEKYVVCVTVTGEQN